MAGEREALVRRACDTIEPPVELACSYPECRCEKAGTVGRVAVVLVDAGWRPPPESQAAGELPWDRDQLGRFVREAWVRWAQTQPVPKPSWLIPYDDLAEADKEVDRQIGEAIARWTIIGQNAKHAITEPQAAAPEVVEDDMSAVLYRARLWADGTTYDPNKPVRGWAALEFARAVVALDARAEAAEQDGALKSKLLARCHSDKDVIRERAQAAERGRDSYHDLMMAFQERAEAAERERDAAVEKVNSLDCCVEQIRRAEAAEAAVKRLEDILQFDPTCYPAKVAAAIKWAAKVGLDPVSLLEAAEDMARAALTPAGGDDAKV